MKHDKVAGPPKPTTTEAIVADVANFVDATKTHLDPQQIEAIYSLVVKQHRHVVEVADRPSKRAYNIARLETCFKFFLAIAASCLAVYTINISINSAKDPAEQSKRAEKLIGELPSILGGLGAGVVLGKQWTKRNK